jgi:hypothetical protein
MIYLNRPHTNNKLPGPSAPDDLKNKNKPWQLVVSLDELETYGTSAGEHGRSNPKKKRIKSTRLVGYLKDTSEGREGFFNELIYHRLAEKIFGDLHPKIHIVENILDDLHSEYSLCIESIGDNIDLKSYAEQQSCVQNPQDISSLKIKHLGCSIAFATLIRSSDSFMKNYVIRVDNKLALYPIDFELIDPNQAVVFANFEINSRIAAKHLITKGDILDYKMISALNLLEQKRIQNGGDTEIETGNKYGVLFYDLLERSCADDIENGLILEMYQSISVIEPCDIDDIVDDCAFLMKEHEVQYYKNVLHRLVNETKSYLETFDENYTQSLKCSA